MSIGRFARILLGLTSIRTGTGSPEGAVVGIVGDVFLRTDGVMGLIAYVKVSGSGNTGWALTGIMQMSTVVLTDAQIKALPTTPITLVSAAPAGYRWKAFSGSLYANTAAGVYTNINSTYCDIAVITSPGGDLALQGPITDNTVSPATLTHVNDLLGAGSGDRLADLIQVLDAKIATALGDSWVVGPSLITQGNQDGDSLALRVDNNGSGNFTGGNAANTMRVTIYYALEKLV